MVLLTTFVRPFQTHADFRGWSITLLALVVITLVGIACGQSDSDGDPGPRDIDTPDEAIGLLPSDWGRYSFFEVARLLDEGPSDYADAFEDFWGQTLDRAGVPIDDVEFIAEARGEWAEHVLVLQGSFDFDAVRDHLTDTDMEEEEYRGFELWKGSGPEVAYEVALMEDSDFILPGSGGVSTVLRRLSREVGLLEYEDESGVQELLDRVGDGWLRQVWTGTDCLHVGVRRCEGSAWSLTPVGRGTDVEVTWAFTFRDERSARMEMEDIEDAFDDIDVLDLEDIDSDGRHIVVSGVLEDHDWQDGGAWALEHLSQAAVPAVLAAPTAAPAAPTSARTPIAAPLAAPTAAPAAPLPQPPTAKPAPATGQLTPTPIAASDMAALRALYESTGGDDWIRRDNWLSERPPDAWYGVDVNSDGRVSGLVLPENGLTGELPPELGMLTALVNLLLQENQLSGEIPAELTDLTSLRWLALSGNPLTGCIPAGLRRVETTDLRDVDLPFC